MTQFTNTYVCMYLCIQNNVGSNHMPYTLTFPLCYISLLKIRWSPEFGRHCPKPPNVPQSYCFPMSLRQRSIKAKKVGSDIYFCPYSFRHWASYLNSLRFTFLICNPSMMILPMGMIIVARPYKAVVTFK